MNLEDHASFQFLAQNTRDIICRAGIDMVLRYVSEASFTVLGWNPEDMVGKRPHAFILSPDEAVLMPLPAGQPSPHAHEQPVVVRMQHKNGGVVWMQFIYHTVFDRETGRPSEIILVMRDVSERKHLEEKLSALLPTDPLTGLATRRTFDDVLEREWHRTARDGTRLSLLLLNFHDFKQFHARQGHFQGDSCLPKAAAAVMRVLRITDLAARHGAEDIAVILPTTGPGGANRVAEKLRAALEPLRCAAKRGGEAQKHAAVSIGISTLFGRPGVMLKTPELLMLAADSALHLARRREVELHHRQAALLAQQRLSSL